MKAAIFDTCTLIRLFKGNALSCLPGLFKKIYIPEAVKNECRDKAVREAISKSPFEIRKVKTVLPLGLGVGEREAISLAIETRTQTIFTDDEKAIRKALSFGLKPYRSFRILILAKEAGLNKTEKTVFNTMEKAGEGIDPDLYFETLKIVGEL